MGTIAIMELKKNMQDKGVWFWTFLLPIIFIIGFMAIFSGGEIEPVLLVTQIVPGYTVMFTFFIMNMVVMALVQDRKSGMVARLASTPLPPYQYFIGKWFPFMVIVLLQIMVLISFGVLVYDLPLGDPLALGTLSLLVAWLTTAWGMAMAVLVKTENMGLALTQVIALGGAMLGGLWMPLDIMPAFVQRIARFLPQHWALEGYQRIFLENGIVTDIWLSLLILFLYGLAGAFVALLAYPRFLRLGRR